MSSKEKHNKEYNFMMYPSIENITNLSECSIKDQVFHIQEKLHGSNFHISKNDNGEFVFNRRKAPLKHGENFFHYQNIIPELKSCSEKIFLKYGPKTKIFGELIGGGYNGRNLPKIKKIQREVEYCPDIRFIPFDIYNGEKFINTSECISALKIAGFTPCPILKSYNSLNEAIKHNEIFKSTIPEYLGLEEHTDDNLAEGIIIRPEIDYCNNMNRCLYKKKNSKFKETKTSNQKSNSSNPNKFLDKYITESRFSSVVSKLVEDAQRNEISDEYVDDVFNELNKDGIKIFSEKEYKKYIKKRIGFMIYKYTSTSK